jgi:hypothetical protein
MILCYLNPSSWAQQYPHVPNVRRPSILLDTRCNESGMYEVVRSGFENLGVIKSVVQVVAEELQIVRLVRKPPVLVNDGVSLGSGRT